MLCIFDVEGFNQNVIIHYNGEKVHQLFIPLKPRPFLTRSASIQSKVDE